MKKNTQHILFLSLSQSLYNGINIYHNQIHLHIAASKYQIPYIPPFKTKTHFYSVEMCSDCRQNAFGQHSRSVFLVFGSKSVYLINNKHFWVPLFPFLAIIFASFFRFMQANVSPTFISIRAFPIICV